ncbi:MAG: transcription termination/antitermination factor NusG [Ruminococcus sp.]|nr:transcription termination/antitermination factor NusG [Ruminococcus sp.]
MAEEAKWYVVHTYSGYENNVKQNIEKVVKNRRLEDLICEVKIPMELYTEEKDSKVEEKERKLFPSYVLVKMIVTNESWYIVRNTRGVTGFVGPASKPVPLTEKEVAALGIESGETKTAQSKISFAPGDRVDIVSGMFEGYSGEVTSIDEENAQVEVVVSYLGRQTPVKMPASDVKAAE